MGLTQGLLATLVADTAPEDMRGTAFGMFNLASGVALLIASVIAGGLWDAYGHRMTFLVGAGFTAIALIGLLIVWGRRKAVQFDEFPHRVASFGCGTAWPSFFQRAAPLLSFCD